MKRLKKILATALLITASVAAPAAAQTAFNDTYKRSEFWWGNACVTTARMVGQEPDAPGRYPVLVYTHGYGGIFNGIEAQKFTDEAARRGFVAASLEYDWFWNISAAGANANARCMYGSGTQSAVTKLCARAKADCSKGVVSVGFSLGGAIAGLARNHSSLVRASYLLGVTGPISPVTLAPPNGTRLIPNNRLRIVVGKQDADRTAPNGQPALDAMTGRSCLGVTNNCIGTDGSGYYIVQNSEVADGLADHCYFHGGGGCSNTPPFEKNWLPPSALPWALGPNLDWLVSNTG